jgi:hypothetical protein
MTIAFDPSEPDTVNAETVAIMARFNLEVFYSTADEQTRETCFWNIDDDEPTGPGWYWWTCFGGCLPEGDPIGPYDTAQACADDATDGLEDMD